MSVCRCRSLFVLLALFVISSSLIENVSAQDKPTFTVKVHAGDFDRTNAIVRKIIDVKGVYSTGWVLRDEATKTRIVAQTDMPEKGAPNELTFVVPSLAKGETLTLEAFPMSTNPEVRINDPYVWDAETEGEMELNVRGKPVIKLMQASLDNSSPERRAETYKVFHHVYAPNSNRLLTKGPGGLFPHHRGIFFGYNRISYVTADGQTMNADTWHCKNGASQTRKDAYCSARGHAVGHSICEIYWRGKDATLALETRHLATIKVGDATVIDFSTSLQPLVANLKLAGDPQHAGVQFRASQVVPDRTKHLTYYVRPDGKAKPGEFRNWSDKKDETEINKAHVDLKWHALCMALPKSAFAGATDETKLTEENVDRYTVCYLPASENPSPARFSERDYGRFGSYAPYDFGDKPAAEAKPMELKYRYWIQPGEMTVEEIDALSDRWLNPVKVELVK